MIGNYHAILQMAHTDTESIKRRFRLSYNVPVSSSKLILARQRKYDLNYRFHLSDPIQYQCVILGICETLRELFR